MTEPARQRLTEFRARLDPSTPHGTVPGPHPVPRRRDDAGDAYRCRPGLTARQWVAAVLDDDVLALLTTLEPDDEDDLLDDLEDPDVEQVTQAALRALGRDLLRQASGWPWWSAIRLVVESVTWWAHLDGPAAGQGVDLLDLPLDRFCNHVYAHIFATFHDQKKLDRWLSELRTAPAVDDDDFVAEDEAAGWSAAAGQFGSGGSRRL